MEFTKEDQGILLLSARASIRRMFEDIPLPQIDYAKHPALNINAGVFVTLHLKNALRGCIGFITTTVPLFEAVCDAAYLAASQDYRFNPVSHNELSQIIIEISVLSQPRKISNYDEITIGTHGLILEDEFGSGLLLPQVAPENNFNVEQFLSALCRKAGLPTFEWKNRFLNISCFTAAVFSEKEHKWKK